MHYIDKIVIANNYSHVTVYLIDGPNLTFNFFKMGMTYWEGIEWLETIFPPAPVQSVEHKRAA